MVSGHRLKEALDAGGHFMKPIVIKLNRGLERPVLPPTSPLTVGETRHAGRRAAATARQPEHPA